MSALDPVLRLLERSTARAAPARPGALTPGDGDRTSRAAPCVPALPVLGHLPRMRRDPLVFFLQSMIGYGDVTRVIVPRVLVHLITHPDDVRRVLQENHKNYTKQTRAYDAMRLGLGEGLLTSEGAFWLRQRRIAQPAFHKQRIAGFANAMTRAVADVAAEWRTGAARHATIDVSQAMMALTLRVVCETLFGTDTQHRAEDVRVSVDQLLRSFRSRITLPIDIPPSWPLPENKRLFGALKTLDDIVYEMIANRRRTLAQGASGDDLLSMFIETKDADTGEHMSDRQLRDEVLTMFLAGHETTANLLTWAFYVLSTHPDVAHRLRAEANAVLGPGDRAATWADLGRLVYTRQVLQETLRLYPPAWGMSRHVVDDDVLGGYTIPAGSMVFLSAWATHRHPAFWENPEGFDPDRFSPERSAGRHPFSFIPFSAGPRVCIGNTFAMTEAQIMLATLVRAAGPALVPGHPVVLEPSITLRPRFGMRMRLGSPPNGATHLGPVTPNGATEA
jgi:cytochrome P450